MHAERALMLALLAAPLSMYVPKEVREKPIFKRKHHHPRPSGFNMVELEIISRAQARRERRWAKQAEIAKRNGWVYAR